MGSYSTFTRDTNVSEEVNLCKNTYIGKLIDILTEIRIMKKSSAKINYICMTHWFFNDKWNSQNIDFALTEKTLIDLMPKMRNGKKFWNS